MNGFHPRSSSEILWRWNGARHFFFFYDRIFFFLTKFILKSTTGCKATLHSSYRWQQTLWRGIYDHHCLRHKDRLPCRWISQFRLWRGGPSQRLSFFSPSCFCFSFCFCLNALSRPFPWPGSWAASQAASCHRRSQTWRLSPLPRTLLRETCLTHTPEDFKVRSSSITALDFSKAAF